ncbi:hypothetical protein SprV_0802535600 [Sparganum proliferum]
MCTNGLQGLYRSPQSTMNAVRQAIRVDKTVYISGQLGLNPETMNLAGDTVEQQAEQALKNLMNIIKEAGGDSKHVVKTTVLLASMDDFPKVNEIYAKYFSEPYPARMCFAVKTLPKVSLVHTY